MAKKKKTLPKDFEALLKKGDIAELKAVFATCELNAYGGYSKQTALAFDECPHELAQWLVEQGADLQATDTRGNTPLHARARSIFGNIKSLLELGANVNDAGSSVGTPLHAAAHSHNVENTALLLDHGAQAATVNKEGLTPLEQALRTCSNIDIVKTAAIAKIYLHAGIPINDKMKAFVTEIGKTFEFHRAGFNKDSVDEYSNALDELYQLFDVAPVTKRALHDGQSPIKVKAKRWEDQHQELWELLVPSSGPAATVQGEVIRVSGRIANELNGNGGINWDSDYKKMADAFWDYTKQGTPLSAIEQEEIESIIKALKQKAGETNRLCELGVQWVVNNPLPLSLASPAYKR